VYTATNKNQIYLQNIPISTHYKQCIHKMPKVYISVQIYFHIVATFTNFASDITRIKILLTISFRNITWQFTQNLRWQSLNSKCNMLTSVKHNVIYISLTLNSGYNELCVIQKDGWHISPWHKTTYTITPFILIAATSNYVFESGHLGQQKIKILQQEDCHIWHKISDNNSILSIDIILYTFQLCISLQTKGNT
jgi:hypothetical protein